MPFSFVLPSIQGSRAPSILFRPLFFSRRPSYYRAPYPAMYYDSRYRYPAVCLNTYDTIYRITRGIVKTDDNERDAVVAPNKVRRWDRGHVPVVILADNCSRLNSPSISRLFRLPPLITQRLFFCARAAARQRENRSRTISPRGETITPPRGNCRMSIAAR